MKTALGPMTLRRAYFHCPSCHTGWFPRDRTLGMVGSSISPAVTRMIGLLGAMVSFEESSELLGELAGLRVDAKQIERTAESLGREIEAHERARSWAGADTVVIPTSSSAPTMYLNSSLAVLYVVTGRTSEVDAVLERMFVSNPNGQACFVAAETLQTLGDAPGAAKWRRRAATTN